MPKFEIEFELTGLKLKIKGDRQDVPAISESLGQQVAGLFQPVSDIAVSEQPKFDFVDAEIVNNNSTKKKSANRKKKPASSNSDGGVVQTSPLDWKHSPETWGMPQQGWNTADKSLWLIYVVGKELGISEISSNQIAKTFNKHFKQAGTIKNFNVTRDLGKLKSKTPALVGQNTTKLDEPWFLVQAGLTAAEKLVANARGSDLKA